MDELNSSSFIFLMYCNNSALAAFYSLINKGLVQLGVISNAHMIPERTNSKRIRGGSEAHSAISTSISPSIGASDECTLGTWGIVFSLKQRSKGIINNCFARLKFLLFIHLLALMFISYGRISVHMEVNSQYAMHHRNIWDIDPLQGPLVALLI